MERIGHLLNNNYSNDVVPEEQGMQFLLSTLDKNWETGHNPVMGSVVGYDLLCDPIHGYCLEVEYMEGNGTPSFSTDHWRDELLYWHENYSDPLPITGEDRYNYECYHPSDGNYAYPGRTQSWCGWIIVPTEQWKIDSYQYGKKAWQILQEILEA